MRAIIALILFATAASAQHAGFRDVDLYDQLIGYVGADIGLSRGAVSFAAPLIACPPERPIGRQIATGCIGALRCPKDDGACWRDTTTCKDQCIIETRTICMTQEELDNASK